MKYAWFVVTLLSARFVSIAVGPPIDGDLAWQRWLGSVIVATHRIPHTLGTETYTAAGAPWTPHEWLFSTVAAMSAARIARIVFALGVAACALAAILLTAYRAARRGAQATNVALISALTGLVLADAFAVKAQIVAWPCLALMMLAVDNEGAWLWAAVPIAAVWSNLHASAMLAPLIVGTIAMGRLGEDRAWTPRVSRAVAVTCAVIGAICCNPLGVGLPIYAFHGFFSHTTAYIREWRSADIGTYGFAYGALPILFCAAFFSITRRGEKKPRLEDILLLAIFTVLLFHSMRHMAIFAIVAAPLLAGSMGELFPENPKFGMPFLLQISFVFFIGINGYILSTIPARTKPTGPVQEIRALADMPGTYRVFCSQFPWNSSFLGTSNVRIFVDGRADPYPLQVWKDYETIAFAHTHWRDLLDAYRVNAIVVARDEPLDQAIALTHDWRDASHDETFRLWMRR